MDRQYVHLSWQNIEDFCYDIISKMDKDNYRPQSIIGLLRGGVVPARIFSDFFDILLDFYALDVKLYNGIGIRSEEATIRPFFGDVDGKNVLIVDDIWDSGKTMEAVLNYLRGEEIKTATLCWKETANGRPDYYSRIVKENEWIVYPWEVCEFKREING